MQGAVSRKACFEKIVQSYQKWGHPRWPRITHPYAVIINRFGEVELI